MKQCIDCRYASPTTGHFMYTCDKHHGKFNAFEHPVCSDYLEDDGGHNCFECDYYTSKISMTRSGNVNETTLKDQDMIPFAHISRIFDFNCDNS